MGVRVKISLRFSKQLNWGYFTTANQFCPGRISKEPTYSNVECRKAANQNHTARHQVANAVAKEMAISGTRSQIAKCSRVHWTRLSIRLSFEWPRYAIARTDNFY
jgi:hypothetical protein